LLNEKSTRWLWEMALGDGSGRWLWEMALGDGSPNQNHPVTVYQNQPVSQTNPIPIPSVKDQYLQLVGDY